MKPLCNVLSKWEKSLLSSLSKLIFIYSTVLLVILPLSPKSAYPSQATLVWNPVIHPDIAGYMIYYGTSSGDYDVSLDVGNWTSVTIASLDGSKTYYFAVTAYSIYGEESGYSNEVSLGAINSSTCLIDTNLVISNEILNTTQTFEACETITAGPSVTVTSTGNITFQAGERVVLRHGFSVENGGRLTIVIDPLTGR